MNRPLKFISLVAAAFALFCVLGSGSISSAQLESFQQESSVLAADSGTQGRAAAQPEMVPALPATPVPMPAPLPDGVPQEALAPPQGAVKVHPVAHIDYDVTHRARKLFGGSPFVELAMVTQNPADGCFYEIPLCLPACCTGEPKMTSYCGLFGRGVVVYCYECGLEIEVKFRLRGDVEVEYGT
jgi:hypothetical protein